MNVYMATLIGGTPVLLFLVGLVIWGIQHPDGIEFTEYDEEEKL